MEKITRQQAADILGIKQSRMYSLIKCGLVPGEKVERTWWVALADVENYKNNRHLGRPPKKSTT